MITTKKAGIMVFGLVIVTFLVLTAAFAVRFTKQVKMGTLGKEHYDLLNSYTAGEAALTYLDSVAKHAYENATYEFALNGGFYRESSCNNEGINIINEECELKKEALKENFDKYMNVFFNDHFKNYKDVYIPPNEYTFNVNEDSIVGMATLPIVSLVGESSEAIDCFPGLLEDFPVTGSYEVEEDSWRSENNPDSIKIMVYNPDIAIVAVVKGTVKEKGIKNGEEFIEIETESSPKYRFRYSHLEVNREMFVGGSVFREDVIGSIGSAPGYINFKAYKENIPMNPLCALDRIGKSNPVKGYHYLKHTVSIRPKYDFFKDVNIVMKTAEEIIKECGKETDKISCVNTEYDNKKISKDLTIKIDDCEGNKVIEGNTIAFCVTSDDLEKQFYTYDFDHDMPENETIKFRFALDLDNEFSAKESYLPEQSAIIPPDEITEARLIWPTTGTITQCFGEDTPGAEEKHGGIDIGAPEERAVNAAAKGNVVTLRIHGRNYDPSEGACTTTYATGTYVIIEHPELGIYTKYSHLSTKTGEKIQEGEEVEQGQTIGYVGNTGCSTGFHLDFRVSESQDFQYSKAKNPEDYLPEKCEHPKQVYSTT